MYGWAACDASLAVESGDDCSVGPWSANRFWPTASITGGLLKRGSPGLSRGLDMKRNHLVGHQHSLNTCLANSAMIEHLCRRSDIARVKRSELGVAGAGLVEPHAIDDFGEELRIFCPQGDTPFPVVQTHTDRDELLHAA